MKYNKIDSLLRLKGLNITKYAEFMGIARQQIANKKKNDTFKADELIKLAELTNTQLAFLDENDKPLIKFDVNDISKS